MKKSFAYWKKLHDREKLEQFSFDEEGLLWLKTKSIMRKGIVDQFLLENSIELIPVELTYLKQQARLLGIDFDKTASPSDIYYEVSERLKDKGTMASFAVLDTIKNETMGILNEVRENPKQLAKWLYENQGEMRFGSENRLFLVLVDTNDFSGSWKLKRNLDLLKPAIQEYLDGFGDKKMADLKVSFKYKGKPQTFSALTDVLFVIK